jgi:hypothetical protein
LRKEGPGGRRARAREREKEKKTETDKYNRKIEERETVKK